LTTGGSNLHHLGYLTVKQKGLLKSTTIQKCVKTNDWPPKYKMSVSLLFVKLAFLDHPNTFVMENSSNKDDLICNVGGM